MTELMDEMSLQQEPGGYDRHKPLSERPLTGENSRRSVHMRPQRKQRAKMLSVFEANRRLRAYKRLVQAAIESENNIDRLMQGVAKIAGEMLGDMCSIMLLNTHNEMYHIAALYDKDPEAVALVQQLLKDVVDIPRDQGNVAKVIKSGKPLLQPALSIEDIKAVAIPSLTEYVDRIGVASSLIVPIQGRSGMLGTVSASRHGGGKPYTAADQAFLMDVGFLLGVALEFFTVIDSLRREVGARQFAKEALAASEERFLSIFHATTLGIQVMDLVGTIIDSNAALQKITGYSEQELVGISFDELVHPEDVGQVANAFTQIKTNRGASVRLEHRMVRSDGSTIWVRATFAGVKKGGGDESLSLIVGIKEDITELKVAEAALVHSERTLAEAQRVAQLGSLELDVPGQVVHASEEALRIFDIPPEEFRGRESIIERTHPDDRQKIIDRSQAVLENGVPEEVEFRVVRPDGSVRIIRDRLAPYYDEAGKATRLLGTVHDVTEQKQAESELTELKRHLQRSIEIERLRLAQELHDVPLQQIYTVIYKLEEMRMQADIADGETLAQLSAELNKTVNTLRSTASELRPPTLSKFGLARAIRSHLADFQQNHPEIQIKHSLADDRQFLPEELRMVLFRVYQGSMANALRHAQPTEIRVSFTFDAEEACIEVTDNGKGFTVPANWLRMVRQGHYGLAGMAERVSAAGGTLTVQSEPGAPTTVRAALPWANFPK